MTREPLSQEVLDYIRRSFPEGLRDPEQALLWVQKSVQSHFESVLPVLLTELQEVVQALNDNTQATHPGFFALLDPGDRYGSTYLKRPASVIEKMYRTHREWEDEQHRPPGERRAIRVHDYEDFLGSMNDLLRFRLLCNYLSDVEVAVKHIGARFPSDGEALRVVGTKDRIQVPPERRHNGHRAVHMDLEYRPPGRRYRFELQVTTLLHWGWDKKDHTLVYEPSRLGHSPGTGDRISIAAASDTLFLIDEYFDGLRRRMTSPTARASRNGGEG